LSENSAPPPTHPAPRALYKAAVKHSKAAAKQQQSSSSKAVKHQPSSKSAAKQQQSKGKACLPHARGHVLYDALTLDHHAHIRQPLGTPPPIHPTHKSSSKAAVKQQ